MKTIFSTVKLKKAALAGLLVLVLASSLCQMLLPAFLSQMISRGVAAGADSVILIYGTVMAGITVLSCIISFLSVKTASSVSTDFAAQLRTKVFSSVLEFSAAEMDHFGTASLITRSTSDIANVQNFLTMLLRIGLMAPMMAAAGLVFSASTGGKVSSVLLTAIPVLLAVLTLLITLASRCSVRLRKKLDHMNRLFLESLEGVRVIRAFNRQDAECRRFEKANEDYALTAIASGHITSLLMPAISVIFGVTTAAVLGIGARYVESGAMEIRSLVANSQYISMVLTAVMMLSLVIMMFPSTYACARRIAEVLDTKPSIKDGNFPLKNRPLRSTVEFSHVTFSYPGADEPVLKDVSFTARPGEVTAIIGGTGRGKSTILKLISRLYDPLSGQVLIDGINAKEYRIEDLRSLIGYVPQKNVLFSGDIASNILFGNPDGGEAVMKEAAQIAQAEEFIEAKSEKYHSHIAQGGSNVSGGQKQRLSIARAIAKRPELFIFDDSFSALDYKTDVALRKALKKKTAQSTVLIVAQRISTILHAEQIIVLDEGKIAGIGTHRELLDSCEVYRQIAASQLSEEELDLNGKGAEANA